MSFVWKLAQKNRPLVFLSNHVNGRENVVYLIAFISAFIFGLSFLFTKSALEYLSNYQLLAARFIIAALLMWLLRRRRVLKVNLKGRSLWGIILMAFFEPIIYFICETQGIRLTTSSEAGLMISMIPVVVAILAALVLKEIPTFLQVISIAMSVGGVALVALGGGALSFSGHALGLLALGGAVLAASCFTILSRRLSGQFTPTELTYVMCWTAAAVFSVMAVIEVLFSAAGAGRSLAAIAEGLRQPQAWGAVLYLGVFSSFGVNYVLSKVEANRSAVLSNLVTIVSVGAGVLFLNEPFYWYHLIGGILIIAGVYGINKFARAANHPGIDQGEGQHGQGQGQGQGQGHGQGRSVSGQSISSQTVLDNGRD